MAGATAAGPETLFGNVSLGYAVIETERFADWIRFGAEAVGWELDDSADGALRFRLDDHTCRILLRRGPAEDLTAIGWEVTDHDGFDEVVARLSAAGIPAQRCAADEAALRGVGRLARFPGPKGIAQEIYTEPVLRAQPNLSGVSGFHTGAVGMGHVAISTRRPDLLHGYYARLLDARLTDFIEESLAGITFKLRFLRFNERHHTVAIAASQRVRIDPFPTRVQHINSEVSTLDDLLAAYGRMRASGFHISMSVGQHTNDRSLSFYARTPSGFDWEVGWNPIRVDESTWEPSTHQGISLWGHTPVGESVIDRLGRIKAALGSLARPEITVPQISGIPA